MSNRIIFQVNVSVPMHVAKPGTKAFTAIKRDLRQQLQKLADNLEFYKETAEWEHYIPARVKVLAAKDGGWC